MSDAETSPSSIFRCIVVVKAPGQALVLYKVHMQLIQTSQRSKLCHLLGGNLRFHMDAFPSLPPITSHKNYRTANLSLNCIFWLEPPA